MSHLKPSGPAPSNITSPADQICEECSDVMAEDYYDFHGITLCSMCYEQEADDHGDLR